MPASHSFTVTAQGGLLRVLQTQCHVCQGFDPAEGLPPHQFLSFNAIWDTGATASVITQQVVDACGLQPIGMVQVHGVHSTELSEVYLVNIRLPNGVAFPNVQVTKGNLPGGGGDLLIGMEIITSGDFSITNKGGVTIFSFRFPSMVATDFVAEHNTQALRESFTHGGTGKVRQKHHKKFGKAKKKK